MSDATNNRCTPEEYLAKERSAEHRSEYYRGEMFAMAGANARHNLICVSLAAALLPTARGCGCKVFGSDMRLRVEPSGLYTYPDLSIACGEVIDEDSEEDVLLNPCVLFEVLSKSTERRDRGWKWEQYRKLPSLIDYVLVSQEKPLLEHYVRQPEGSWNLRNVAGLEATLSLTVVVCHLPLADIYQDVDFGPERDENSGVS